MQAIYIVYARVDKRYIRELVELLTQADYQVNFEISLEKNETWQQELKQQIQSSDAGIYAMSPDSLYREEWCQWEFGELIKAHKPVVPVIVRPATPLPEVFKSYTMLDFSYGTATHEAEILPASLPEAMAEFPVKMAHSKDWYPQGIPSRAPLQRSLLTYYGQNSHMASFYRAYAGGDWRDALTALKSLKSEAKVLRGWEQYQLDVLSKIEREKWVNDIDHLYERLKKLVEADPERGQQALQRFWSNYPGYDPDKLYDEFVVNEIVESDETLENMVNVVPETPPMDAIPDEAVEAVSTQASMEGAEVVYVTDDVRLSPEVQLLIDLIDRKDTSLERRAEAGRELANYGDPRPGVGLRGDGLPDIDWILIPAGDFIYQDGMLMKLNYDFYISRYQVTNIQFQAFLDDPDGYDNLIWWQGLAVRQDTPGISRWKEPNHPREKVSWYDAMAFCRWLEDRFEFPVRLPTEKEWEKAARGPDSRHFPYPGEFRPAKCNVVDTGIRRTTAVGIFPEGASYFGVMDMSGNVWEWCLSELETGAHVMLNSEAKRVIRGGAWNSIQRLTSISVREGDYPFERTSNRGFRIVCEAPEI